MVSKSKRFEIFKRDGFTCQYCGQRPPDVVLEVDHIDPRANGGSDDDMNLITACFDCNRGKRDKVLGNVAPKPDADLEYLKLQQEMAEIKRYMQAKEIRDKHIEWLIKTLQLVWSDYLTTEYVAAESVIRGWLTKYSAEEVDYAIKAAALSYQNGRFGNDEERAINPLIRYISAVLRNRRDEPWSGR